MSISNEEKEKRKKIVDSVRSNFELEGMPFTARSEEIYTQWVNGDITLEQAEKAIKSHWIK